MEAATQTTQAPQAPRAALAVGGKAMAIIPQDIDQAMRLAKFVAAANWAPRSYLRDPKQAHLGLDEYKIVTGIMHGLELGLTPIASLQSIAVINGIPSIYGDGALAVVQASGLLEDFKEEAVYDDKGNLFGFKCTAKRKGLSTPQTATFTLEDAAKAKLLDKPGPWQEYRSRMCQMRARAWALRAAFADVLRGMSIAEEAQDVVHVIDVPVKPATKPVKQSARATLDAFSGSGSTEPQSAATTKEEANEHQTHPEGAA